MKVSDFLKNSTAQYHTAAEEKFNSKKIFNQTYTLDDYRRILRSNYMILQNAEAEISRILSEDKEFSEKIQLKKREKLHLIKKDAETLNLAVQFAGNTIAFANFFEALGALYVIEGSTLGGNVMAKQLKKTAGFENASFYYFGCYKEETGSMWKNFKEILDETVKTEEFNQVLAGAEKIYTQLLAS